MQSASLLTITVPSELRKAIMTVISHHVRRGCTGSKNNANKNLPFAYQRSMIDEWNSSEYHVACMPAQCET